jgi:hypothetical protein
MFQSGPRTQALRLFRITVRRSAHFGPAVQRVTTPTAESPCSLKEPAAGDPAAVRESEAMPGSHTIANPNAAGG